MHSSHQAAAGPFKSLYVVWVSLYNDVERAGCSWSRGIPSPEGPQAALASTNVGMRTLALSGDERLWVNSRVALTLTDKMKGHFSALEGICPLLALFVCLHSWPVAPECMVYFGNHFLNRNLYFLLFPPEMWCGN